LYFQSCMRMMLLAKSLGTGEAKFSTSIRPSNLPYY